MTSPSSGADSAPDLPGYAPVPRPAPGPPSASERAAAPVATAGGSSRLGLALLVIATAQLMVVLDATIVNVALPHVQSALGFPAGSPPARRGCSRRGRYRAQAAP